MQEQTVTLRDVRTEALALEYQVDLSSGHIDRVLRHVRDQRIKKENIGYRTLAFLSFDTHLYDWHETLIIDFFRDGMA